MKKRILAFLMAGMLMLSGSAAVSAADDFTAAGDEIQLLDASSEENTEVSEEDTDEISEEAGEMCGDEISVTDEVDFTSEEAGDSEDQALTEQEADALESAGTSDTQKNFQITFSMYGDSKHGKQVHGEYICWIPAQRVSVPEGATVKYITEQILNEKGIKFSSDGSYVDMINGLSEFDNGRNSGWMYTVNGEIVQVGYADYVLKKDDVVQWFYTDDYMNEDGIRPEASHRHAYVWKTISRATVFQPEKQEGTCSGCGAKIIRDNGSKLTATIKLNVKSIKLQTKQTTKKIQVYMANGDSIKSWKSSNKKIVTVSKNGVIKAGKKTGTAKITVTLASGKKATLKVTVQNAKVKTTKISGLKSKITLKKGKKLTLKPVISPITSPEKVIYSTSNKKVATVNAKGVITAKKKGTVKITVKSGSKKKVIKVAVK